MNYRNNEYLVPVFIGGSKANLIMARRIRKQLGVKGHSFAVKHSILDKFAFQCHKVDPMRDELLILSLQAFFEQLDEYFCPVIVICDVATGSIVDRIRDEIEYAFVITDGADLLDNRL